MNDPNASSCKRNGCLGRINRADPKQLFTRSHSFDGSAHPIPFWREFGIVSLTFALNHRVAPGKDLGAFFDLTRELGIRAVEIRNDLPGTAMLDGTAAAIVRAEAQARGFTVLSINALQRFNEWNAVRSAEAAAMIDYARACDAKAIVLCPVNDHAFQPGEQERLDGLRQALRALAPLLRQAGVIGLVEPLGFVECSLRSKREAVEAIEAVQGGDVLQLVHDTFHHHVAGELALYPHQTGLVHISGVVDPSVAAETMRDPHRVLVDADDRIDNIGQIRALLEGGYKGVFSFEPFADSVSELADAGVALASSIAHITDEVVVRRA
jgi:2-keto-myo-inositol isomerase